jgi:hypothetical protein
MAITAPSAIGSIKLGSLFLTLPTWVFTGQPMRAEQHISGLGAVKYKVASTAHAVRDLTCRGLPFER